MKLDLFTKKKLLHLHKINFKNSFAEDIQIALVSNDIEELNQSLNDFMLRSMSYMDAKSEVFYQGFMLGLGGLFTDQYELKQNLEAGYGRFDFRLIPLQPESGLPAIIMEFKYVDGDFKSQEDMDEALKTSAIKAIEQIQEKKYDADIWAKGCKSAFFYGAAFHKKNVVVESLTVEK